MNFKKYQHIERFGNDEVEGIEIGVVHVFPKLDGSNGSVWTQYIDNGIINDLYIKAGSSKRELSLDNDNHGFMAYVINNKNIQDYLLKYPNHRLFGEWLVPHALKTYREDAWRKFYVFDIMIEDKYLSYEEYKPLLEEFNIDYVPCMSIIHNADPDKFQNQLMQNVFLIQEGQGVGEGIVLKNYNYINKYGRQTWAKIVTSEFKEKHIRHHGPTEIQGKISVEDKIVDEYVTTAFVEKTFQKILKEVDDHWRSQYIPRLLNTVYHELIIEEMWNIIKKFKNPTIDFKKLKSLTDYRIKIIKPGLF